MPGFDAKNFERLDLRFGEHQALGSDLRFEYSKTRSLKRARSWRRQTLRTPLAMGSLLCYGALARNPSSAAPVIFPPDDQAGDDQCRRAGGQPRCHQPRPDHRQLPRAPAVVYKIGNDKLSGARIDA